MGPFEGFLGLFSNFPSFDATERLFRSNWGSISPESDWCNLKTFVATNLLLLQIFVATNFCCNNFCYNKVLWLWLCGRSEGIGIKFYPKDILDYPLNWM